MARVGHQQQRVSRVDCYWKSIDFERTTARELFTVDSACNGDPMNNGFAFAAKNAICTEASYSYTCLATKGTCKAAFSWKFLSRYVWRSQSRVLQEWT